jgi:MFS transporter, DHA1 family, multidrug resistance protein
MPSRSTGSLASAGPTTHGGPGLAVLLTLLVALGPVSTDLYLPSLPGIAADLGASPSLVQLTLGLFVAGLALMQLVAGPLADRFGRRPVLFVAMAVYAMASLGCLFAPGIALLLAARLVQALGASAGPVIGRAVVRDLYGPTDSARILSYMASAMAIAPLVAPFLGGWLEVAFGWRASFLALFLYAVLLSAMLWRRLPETLPDGPRPTPGMGDLVRRYLGLVADPLFSGFVLCAGATFAGLFTWITNSAFVIVDRFGVAPDRFAWYFGIVIIGYALGAFAGGRLGHLLGGPRTLALGVACGALAGLLLGVLGTTGRLDLLPITLLVALYFAGCGLVLPQSMAGALAPFPHIAGTAAALLGCLQMLAGLLANLLSALLFDGSERPMAGLIAASALIALLAFHLLVRPRWRPAPA